MNIISEGKAASHNVKSLNGLSRELRDKLTEEMKILSEKISELDDISKDAWRQLSEIEDDVKKMFARVYATVNAKVGRHVCREYRQLLCRVTA